MRPPRIVRWLHISDLQCPPGRDHDWENASRRTLDRLGDVLQGQRPVDLVVVSGDIARTGHPAEYNRASQLFQEICERLTQGPEAPVILAAPGNHDLQRSNRPASHVADTSTESAFSNWNEWWTREVALRPNTVEVYTHDVPGDFAATLTFEDRDLRFGVVAVNTTTGTDDQGSPSRLAERLNAVTGRPPAWVGYHHATIFVSHHPPVRPEAHTRSWRELEGAGFASAHCGHLHRFDEAHVTLTEDGMILARAMSFAGYEPRASGSFAMLRPCGVVLGEVNFDPPEQALLRVWEYDLSASSGPWREPVASRWIARDPTAQTLPEGHAPALARRPPEQFEPNRFNVERLLREVLPGEVDFRGFTLAEMPEQHDRLPHDTTRDARTRVLFEEVEPAEVYRALQRYLPETTAKSVRWLIARG